MMDDDPEMRLAEAITSRMAHDLAGAVGGLNNGLELLAESNGGPDQETMAHLSACGLVAASRLAFYRMAYGRAGNDMTSVSELRELAFRFVEASGRCQCNWPMPPIMSTPEPGEGKLILLCVEVALDALPRGGCVTVLMDEDDGNAIEVSSNTDDSPTFTKEILAALTGDEDLEAPTSRTVHAVLAKRIAKSVGRQIRIDVSQRNSLTIRIG